MKEFLAGLKTGFDGSVSGYFSPLTALWRSLVGDTQEMHDSEARHC